MTIRLLRIIAILSLCVAVSGRGQRQRVSTADPIPELIARVVDTSYARYLHGLQAFGTRYARQSNRDSVAAWIADQFRAMGLTDVAVDSFAFDTTRQWNVIATMAGTEPAAGEIVVGGHYDSQSSIPTLAPGADDNASGTSAVLEMARALHTAGYVPRHTLRFVAFGAEEMGLVGSEWFASRLPFQHRTVVLMLNFDMIGRLRADQGDRDVSIVWYEGAYDEARLDSALFRTYTSLTPFLTTQYRTQSDSWPFAKRGIKSIFHIESDFNTLLHTPHDSTTFLDMTYASEVVRGGLAMLVTSDGVTATGVWAGEVPSGWTLEQNFPNPFNGQTVLRYRVAGNGDRESGSGYRIAGTGYSGSVIGGQGSVSTNTQSPFTNTGYPFPNTQVHVSLKIYDLLGREVGALVDEIQPDGMYTVRWNAAGRASGTYVARLEMIGYGRLVTQTRMMMLVK